MSSTNNNVRFYLGDCIEMMEQHVTNASIDLIYLDPPYDSNKVYTMSVTNTAGFNDKWKGNEYSLFLKKVIDTCKKKLKPTGTLYLHISATGMYVPEQILRETFDYVQPIFWKKCRAKNCVKQMFGTVIDILFKCNTQKKDVTFHVVQQPKTETYLKNGFKNKDEKGAYALGHVITEPTKKGYIYEFEFNGKKYNPVSGWRISKEELEKLRVENRLHVPKTDRATKVYKKIYLNEFEGKACTDLWDDISCIAKGNELRQYPTAKPYKLLERIVKVSSNEGDTILDPMCGSGVMGRVCADLNRHCILCDKQQMV